MALAIACAKDNRGEPLYNLIDVDVPNEAEYKKAMSINDRVFSFENNDKKLEEAQKDAYKIGNLWATTDYEYF